MIKLGAITVIIIGYLFASPYISMYQFKKSIENQDSKAVSKLVNFEILKANIKDKINKSINDKVGKQESSLAIFALEAISKLGDEAIDTYVTSDSIIRLSRGGKPNPKFYDSSNSDTKEPFFDADFSYASINEFHIVLNSKNIDLDENVIFILKRNFLTWELVDINLSVNQWM